MAQEIEQLHKAAMAAEAAWEHDLSAAFGKEACNARYDSRGASTPTLAAGAAEKIATYEAFRVAAFPHASA